MKALRRTLHVQQEGSDNKQRAQELPLGQRIARTLSCDLSSI